MPEVVVREWTKLFGTPRVIRRIGCTAADGSVTSLDLHLAI